MQRSLSSLSQLTEHLMHFYRITSYNVCYTKLLRGNISLELPTIQPVHESDEYMEVENTFNESLEFYFKKNIKQALTQKLEVNGLSPKEISVIVNKDENNCISISEVKIVLAVQDEKLIQKAREIIKNELGT